MPVACTARTMSRLSIQRYEFVYPVTIDYGYNHALTVSLVAFVLDRALMTLQKEGLDQVTFEESQPL